MKTACTHSHICTRKDIHTSTFTHTKAPQAKMVIPVQVCNYQHQHSRSSRTFYPCPEPSPPGKPLILTDRIHFLCANRRRRPIVCQNGCKEADVSVWRSEEGHAVEAHILSAKLFSLSPTASPQHPAVKTTLTLSTSEVDKEAGEEFPQ